MNMKQKDVLSFWDFFKKGSESDFDVQFFLNVISHKSNIYYYYGNLKKNSFYISDNMCKRFGFKHNIVYDFVQKWSELIYSKQAREELIEDLDEIYTAHKKIHDLRYRIRDISGNIIWVRCYGEVKFDSDGKTPLYFVGYVIQQDDYLLVDPVTNFPTDAYFVEYLKELKRENKEVIGIGINFNHFAEINADMGREFTDQILKQICNQLNHILNVRMKFFRLDGPKVVAILDTNYLNELENIIYLIRNSIRIIYKQNNVLVKNPCSFAILKNTMSATNFIENMTILLRRAKSSPDEVYLDGNVFKNRGMETYKDREMYQKVLQINKDVMSGMDHFRVMIQPVVSAHTEQILGGETLLRWTYNGKDENPQEFVELLEKENLIKPVGRWIFEQAVQTCKLISLKNPDFYLSVNVSLLQLQDTEFVPFIHSLLKKYQLSGSSIILEMTESCLDQSPDIVQSFISQCQELGIRIALDDFGTGYSSLKVLLKYPIQFIKVDRSLLLEMEESEEKKAFVSSFIHACQAMGKKVVIEGVESMEQREIVRQTGFDIIQGYLYYKPLDKSVVRDMWV